MPRVATNFNWGTALRNENPDLTRQMSSAYEQTALCVNTKISKYVTTTDAPNAATANAANKNLEIGDIWVNKSLDRAWIMTSRTTDVLVTWKLIT